MQDDRSVRDVWLPKSFEGQLDGTPNERVCQRRAERKGESTHIYQKDEAGLLWSMTPGPTPFQQKFCKGGWKNNALREDQDGDGQMTWGNGQASISMRDIVHPLAERDRRPRLTNMKMGSLN